jgi:O-antigen/teichoic acid export membrane protein
VTASSSVRVNAGAPEPWPFLRAVFGSGVLAVGDILARALAFIAIALLTRRLGPEVFGMVAFATAIAGFLLIAVNNGVPELAARDVAADPSSASRVYAAAATVRIGFALAAWAVVVTIALLLDRPPEARAVVALTGLSFVATAVDPSWALKALERAPAVVLVLLAAQAGYALGVFLLVDGPGAVARVPVVQYGAELVANAAAVWLLLGRRLPAIDLGGGWALLSRARFLTASRLARGLTVSFDMLLLGAIGAAAPLGVYAACYRVLFLLMVVGTAIGSAFLPALTRAATAGTGAFRRAASAAFTMSLAVGAPLSIGAALVAPDLLHLLFGSAYASGAVALRLLMLAGGCFIVHSALGNVFLAREHTLALSRIHVVAAVVNVVVNVWAIPRYGIVGAAAATLAAEGLTAVAEWWVIGRVTGLASRLPAAVVVAAGVMAGTTALLSGQPLGVRVAAGAVVYVAVLAAAGGAELRGIVTLVLGSVPRSGASA